MLLQSSNGAYVAEMSISTENSELNYKHLQAVLDLCARFLGYRNLYDSASYSSDVAKYGEDLELRLTVTFLVLWRVQRYTT